MKMREVCARTGLTDRTVRYWTEQGLLSPEREEQNGRLYFRFTEEDVAALEKIALLRQAGFSIERIAAMQKDPAAIAPAVRELRSALDTQRREAEEAAQVLSAGESCADLEALLALLGDKRALFPPPEPRFDRFDLLSPEERREAARISREGLESRERRKGLLLQLGGAVLLVVLAVLLTLALTGQLRRTPRPADSWADRYLSGTGTETIRFLSLEDQAPDFTGLDGATGRSAALFTTSGGRVALSWGRLGASEGELLESLADGREALPWEPDPDSPGLVCWLRGAEGWYALYAQGESLDRAALGELLSGSLTLLLAEEGQPERQIRLFVSVK